MDLDMECLRPFDALMNSTGVLLSKMADDPTIIRNDHALPNSWLASSAGHPFWLFLLEGMVEGGEVEETGGSVFLLRRYREWTEERWSELDGAIEFVRAGMRILDVGLIFPYDWRVEDEKDIVCGFQKSTFSAFDCKRLLDSSALTVSYWTKTYGNWMMEGKLNLENS